MSMSMSISEVIRLALECDDLAKRIGHRFELDEFKLEAMGFSSDQIDEIMEKTNLPKPYSWWARHRG